MFVFLPLGKKVLLYSWWELRMHYTTYDFQENITDLCQQVRGGREGGGGGGGGTPPTPILLCSNIPEF